MTISDSESRASTTANPDEAGDSGLAALAGIAAFYRVPVDPQAIHHEFALRGPAQESDLLRAAKWLGLLGRVSGRLKSDALATLSSPAIIKRRDGRFAVLAGTDAAGALRVIDPLSRVENAIPPGAFAAAFEDRVILLRRRLGGPGANPNSFGWRWFMTSIWRFRVPLAHVLIASLFVQMFALITPVFFQAVIDKVLVHRTYSTLLVLVVGLVLIGLFDVVLQYIRTYVLAHTTNRIDVELGQRLFAHLLRLPMSYFETRSAGQTVARMRELETIRNFLTGAAIFSVLDVLFTIVFLIVLALYSLPLSLIVVASIPAYVIIAAVLRGPLRRRIDEKFDRGAQSQQLLVETVIGIQTVKASAIEPLMRQEWEERLAAFVSTAFKATVIASGGQSAIQYVNKFTTAAILLFGAKAVIDGDLTVGGLVAFNMIAAQVSQPVLRLSQFWQDLQQVQVSMARIGDLLEATPEPAPAQRTGFSRPTGAIAFDNVSFSYRPGAPEVLRGVSLDIKPGEVIGIVGPSGSGKSTLAKLIQRFHIPTEGRVLIDDIDISKIDPTALRQHMGVVLQENLLFNRSIHDNIALANPGLTRELVTSLARFAGADEFIAKLPNGYDTMIEERGTNLSGGQRQRIAIARALATNPAILIFDEATSALDYESERVIRANMRFIASGRTVVIIAHRLAAVRDCDRIFGMVDGQIVEQGGHNDLLRSGGLYAHLWNLQMGHEPERVSA